MVRPGCPAGLHADLPLCSRPQQQAGVATAIYDAFLEAKEITARSYRDAASKQNPGVLMPWLSALVAENRQLLSDDWWPYGLAANRTAVDTFLRSHHEQWLSERLLTSDDIFAGELLNS